MTSKTLKRQIGRRYGEYRPFPNIERRNTTQGALEIPFMVRALAVPKGVQILEVGCGIGNALGPLARSCQPARLVGIDIDQEALAQAAATIRRQRVSAELYHADVRRFPFADGAFDVVIDFGTCYHIARPGEAVREIARVLRDDGLFVYETRLNQFLSHPVRSYRRRLPWDATKDLRPDHAAVFWGRRRKQRFNIHHSATGGCSTDGGGGWVVS